MFLMEEKAMSRPREAVRLQRIPGREGLFDLFRQVREKIRREKATGLFRSR
jgi:hypothetical protein